MCVCECERGSDGSDSDRCECMGCSVRGSRACLSFLERHSERGREVVAAIVFLHLSAAKRASMCVCLPSAVAGRWVYEGSVLLISLH